jgi:cyclophilin family peptidyl-prolyl cis-trans isomerase
MPHVWRQPPKMEVDPSKRYTAALGTSHGTIVADLFASEAPKTVNNFVFLARQGFYDGVVFHRVIDGFVIQGGDPEGTGRGGPGYEFEDELDNDLRYEDGALAMANAGPNTNGSQFFIVCGPQGQRLPKQYSIFGKVRDGMDVVRTIAGVPTGPGDRPRQPVVIERVTVEETSPAG